MDIRDYEKILDAIPTAGVFVVREDNHEVLYFNSRIKEMAPNVCMGKPCNGMWQNSCSNCPLLSIGERDEYRSINCDNLFGTADVVAKGCAGRTVPESLSLP